MQSHSKNIKDFYNTEAQEKFGHDYETNRWFKGALDRERYGMLLRSIRHFLEGVRYARCFELGPGPGTWTKVLLAHAPKSEYVLLDISESMKKQFEENVGKANNVHYRLGDFESYKEEGKPYDFFFSSRAIEYIKDKEKVARRIRGLMRPGGYGIIVTKTPHYFKKRLLGQHTPWYHQDQILPRRLMKLMKHQGFRDVKAYPAIIYIPVVGRAHWINRLIHRYAYKWRLFFLMQWISEAYIVIFRS